MVITCQHCRQRLNVPHDKGRLRITCPACKGIFLFEPESHIEENSQDKSDNNREYIEKGLQYAKTGRLAEAAEALQQAIILNPRDPWPHIYLGTVFTDQNKLDDAIEEFNKALELSPLTEAYKELGAVLRKKGMLEEAVNILSYETLFMWC